MHPHRSLAVLISCLCPSLASADITNITQGTTHATIQEAIDQAVDHDEIVVDPGVYVEQYIDLQGKAITLRSQDPTDPEVVLTTVINAMSSGPAMICYQGEGPDTLITGFVMTGSGDSNAGMLILSCSPTISHCTFQGNTGHLGGGMHLEQSNAVVSHSTFIDNEAWIGGGMHITSGDPTISNCAFFGNSTPSGSGGGMLIENNSSPTITDCTFESNTARDDGGGIALKVNCSPTITGCSFRHNEAATGGGVFLLGESSPMLTDCSLINNVSTYSGGGIYVLDDGSLPTLKDTIVCGNRPDQISGFYSNDGGNVISPFAPPPAEPVAPCPEDIDGDGVVGQSDLGMLLAMYGQNCP